MKNKLGVLMIVAILATTYDCGSKKAEESASTTDTTKVAADTTKVAADTTKAK